MLLNPSNDLLHRFVICLSRSLETKIVRWQTLLHFLYWHCLSKFVSKGFGCGDCQLWIIQECHTRTRDAATPDHPTRFSSCEWMICGVQLDRMSWTLVSSHTQTVNQQHLRLIIMLEHFFDYIKIIRAVLMTWSTVGVSVNQATINFVSGSRRSPPERVWRRRQDHSTCQWTMRQTRRELELLIHDQHDLET